MFSKSPVLPIVERWDCHSCGVCCRGTTVPLDRTDLRKIREQGWEETEELAGQKTIVRSALLGGKMVLGKQPNGDCIFLNENNRCRIHEKFGADAKPSVCRVFPFHAVPTKSGVRLTARRSCPSAADDRGSPVSGHVNALKSSGLLKQFTRKLSKHPPPVGKGARRSWIEFEAAADALARIVNDETFPMVRRMVHALQFCDLLSECKLEQVAENAFGELVEVLEQSCLQGAGDWFREIQAPSGAAQSLLRQTGLHYLRSHPQAIRKESLRGRLGATWQSFVFAKGKGRVPRIAADFPSTKFAALEKPLGPVAPEVSQPLHRYYETQTQSRHFAFLNPKRTLIASFRCLAITYPIALWMTRLMANGGTPQKSAMTEIVVAIERGQGLSTLPTLANSVSESGQLLRLIAWYAR